VSVTVTDQSGFTNDTVEIEIDDGPTPVDFPPVGSELTVVMGYGRMRGAEARYNGVDRVLGRFTITEVNFSSPPDRLTIKGHAKDTASSFKKHRARSFNKKSMKDIFEKIAKDEGLTLKMSGDVSSLKIPHIDQPHQSNMDFGMRVARRFNCTMKVVEGNLYVGPRGSETTISGRGVQNITVYRSDCSSYTALLQKKSKHDGVKARYHDHDSAEEKEEVAGAAGKGKVTKSLPFKFPSKEEAKKAAEAEKETLDREGETVSLETVGHPSYAAEARLTLVGFRPGMRTSWLINSVTHKFEEGGYTCSIQGEVPGSSSSNESVGGRNDGQGGSSEGD
jgi:hypothetical protein